MVQRRFTLYMIIGVFLLLIFFYNPQPKAVPILPNDSVPTYNQPDTNRHPPQYKEETHSDSKAPQAGKVEQAFPAESKINHAPQVIDKVEHAPQKSQEISTTSAPAHTSRSHARVAAEVTSKSEVVPASHAIPVTSNAAIVTSSVVPTRSQDDYRSVTDDEFAYLSATTSESLDAFAYLSASTSESLDAFAYLVTDSSAYPTPTSSSVDAFAYLTTSSESLDAFAYLSASPTESIDAFAYLSAAPTPTADAEKVPANETELWGDGKEGQFFQADLTDFELPTFDREKMKSYAPHNWRGPGHEAYATFLATRNSSLHDPYFLATMQQVYRLLWDPRSQSKGRPFVVYVAEYIPQLQRDYLQAAGAMVKELEVITYHPTQATSAQSRWRDMFSKLNLWNELDFSLLLYLDTDATPLVSLDELFDKAKIQQCEATLLRPEDQLTEICDYVFLAAVERDAKLNAGMMVVKPNKAMHAHLLRESQTDNFDTEMMEQSFVQYAFRDDGPFPAQKVGREWNAVRTDNDDEGQIYVVHEKLWAMWFMDHFAKHYFRDTWDDMLKLWNSQDFVSMRAQDGNV